jgi:hypothetical protein
MLREFSFSGSAERVVGFLLFAAILLAALG